VLEIDGGIHVNLCVIGVVFWSYFVKLFARFNSNTLAHDNWCLKSDFGALFGIFGAVCSV
jgi:divalent metal cation (Fe/Co/Zn/Cd) transporter